METNFWSKLNKYDKRKLIYAYIVSPLIIMASLGGNFTSEIYGKTGQVINPPCGAIFGLVMMTYIPTILPAMVIRFGYFKRPLSYGLEMFISMWVSITVSLLLMPFVIGVSLGTHGLLGDLSIYCALSYGANGHNDIPKQKRYLLTLLTIASPFVVFYLLGTPTVSGFFLFYEAPFIAIMVNCHLPKTSETIHNSSAWQSTTTNHSSTSA